MKLVVFTGIGIIILAIFCVILFTRLERDSEVPVDISTKNAETEVTDVNSLINSLPKPKIPVGWSEDFWVKEFDEELAKEAALEAAQWKKEFYEHTESMFAKKRSALSDADLAEIDSMLSKFESLENMSESAIIDTLLSFYPDSRLLDEELRQRSHEGRRQGLIEYYRGLDGLSEPDAPELTKDQKLQFMVYLVQDDISTERKIKREVAEEARRDQALKESDPDLYFDKEEVELADTIREVEESLREAEESGDTEMAETWRNHLSILHEMEEGQDDRRELITSIIKGTSEEYFLKDHPIFKDLPQLDDNLVERAQELIDEVLDQLERGMSDDVPSDVFSDDSESAPPSSVPAKGSVSAPSGSDFEPLLKNIGEKYFDVVLSRHLSEKEFEKYFPSSQYDREMLKSRTREMQKTLVSEIRKVMRNMNDVSEATKRQRVKDFVMKNYDKDFAEAVLRQLNADDK